MNTNTFIVTGKQIELDMKLVPFDLRATRVHVLMLSKQKIIEEKKAKNILDSLEEIDRQWQQGTFKIDPDIEYVFSEDPSQAYHGAIIHGKANVSLPQITIGKGRQTGDVWYSLWCSLPELRLS